MKRLCLFSLIFIFVLASTIVYAEERPPLEKAPLGIGNVALKLDYIGFSDNNLEDLGIDDTFYVGLEGYARIYPNLYLGGEVGYANPDGNGKIDGNEVKTDVTFIPIELNLKYAALSYPNFVVGFGAGVSYNYVEADVSGNGIKSGDDWLFGGQFFADLNYTVGSNLFFGVDAKYQLTDDFEDWNANFSNFRIGGHIGIRF
jgi:hypothetical protein